MPSRSAMRSKSQRRTACSATWRSPSSRSAAARRQRRRQATWKARSRSSGAAERRRNAPRERRTFRRRPASPTSARVGYCCALATAASATRNRRALVLRKIVVAEGGCSALDAYPRGGGVLEPHDGARRQVVDVERRQKVMHELRQPRVVADDE